MTETRTCKNCQQNFTIEPEDFAFYEKMKVPAPTWCPACRMARRMMVRNERVLYSRNCQGEGHNEKLISTYSPEKPVVVYDQKLWWSDSWEPTSYGKEYDFGRPFFEQFKELWQTVPLVALSNSNAINSDYCNVADQSKDSYLVSGSFKIEKVMYSNRVYNTKDSLDMYVSFRNELCYECVHCSDCYRVRYSYGSESCRDSYFLYDCRNCSDCFGCTNLRNKQYCIYNEQYTKDEYFAKIKSLNLDSRASIEGQLAIFEEIRLGAIHKYAHISKSVNSTGDNIDNAKNCVECFDMTEGTEDCKYMHWGGINTKDAYDGGPGIGDRAELMYEAVDTGIQGSNIAFTYVVYGSHNIRYALFCHGSHDLFGCIGLRSKEYCILNKQYSPEEYKDIVPKIIEQMNALPYTDSKGRVYGYGEFFPPEIMPFNYNETIAQDYIPLTKDKALEYGYGWQEREERHHSISLRVSEIPDSITDIGDAVLDEIIECEHLSKCTDGCTTAFKIIPAELEFYRNLRLPIPKLCFACRHMARVRQKPPLKLWHRKCMKSSPAGECANEFETSYAPDRPEIVYCESCYQQEVV